MFFHRQTKKIIYSLALASTALFCGMQAEAKEFVVVIDPGHGGKDSGALGKQTTEKAINLDVAKLLGAEIKRRYDDIRVVYTRSTDVFVTIKGRMDKAKSEKADLFISLHCNSAAYENPRRTSLAGTSVYVLGNNNANDNIDMAMRENEAILLEDDYKTTYKGFDNSPEYYIFTEINQSKMMGKSNSVANAIQRQLVSHAGLKDNRVNETSRLWLLLHSTMPAVLVEMDFICNPNREKFLSSSAGQQKIAEAICNGINDYRRSLGHKVGATPTKSASEPKADKTDKEDPAPSKSETPSKSVSKEDKNKSASSAKTDPSITQTASDSNEGQTVYSIQFLVESSQLKSDSPKLRGITPADFYRDGSSYKYHTGQFPTMEAAATRLKEVRRQFPDAFIIKMRDGKRIK